MKIKIINCSVPTYWYVNKINTEYDAIDVNESDQYFITSYCGYVKKCDCEILPEPVSFEEDYDTVVKYYKECDCERSCSDCVFYKFYKECPDCADITFDKNKIHEAATLIRESNNK